MIRQAALIVATLTCGLTGAAAGQQRDLQQEIRQNRQRIDAIRRERDSLEQALTGIRTQARDITDEIRNLNRQRTAVSSLVNELDRQLSGLTNQVDTLTLELILTEDALDEKQAVQERRIGEIYKRGQLWAVEVMLAAESFGDLLSRYKYLYLVTRHDRLLVTEIEGLRQRLAAQRNDLVVAQREMSSQRAERDVELRNYATVERRRERTLNSMRASERAAAERIGALEVDLTRLNDRIVALERERRAAVARGDAGSASITTVDVGTLDWPVDGGTVAYRFGPQGFRDGTRTRRDGIGISVPVGSPVRAVRGGRVVLAESYGTYGLSVMISHGDGYYTLYLHLSDINVVLNSTVSARDVLGLSGGANSEIGPHIEFQLRQTPANGQPIALDPLVWLRPH